MPSTHDETEPIRRSRTLAINGEVETYNPEAERQRLEAQHGQVWSTEQLAKDFEVLGFMAPYIAVKRRSDGLKGSLEFQHLPRFYFNFVLDKSKAEPT